MYRGLATIASQPHKMDISHPGFEGGAIQRGRQNGVVGDEIGTGEVIDGGYIALLPSGLKKRWARCLLRLSLIDGAALGLCTGGDQEPLD